MTPMPISSSNDTPSTSDVAVHMAYVEQQQLDGANQAVAHANCCKAAFNQQVLKSTAGKVIFKPGQLVQVYANALDMTLSSSQKLQPQWSAPRCIISRVGNSYTINTLEGFPINGLFHARRLCQFIPRDGTALTSLQEALQETIDEEDLLNAWGQELDAGREE
jgi:hypothetical protein